MDGCTHFPPREGGVINMQRPKRAAIIGAGPSGLVTAKTLLHNFPEGTFAPIIFERRHAIGGLWPTGLAAAGEKSNRESHLRNRSTGTVNPSMRTNLSRFTVGFSDLSWESALSRPEVPMFPRAWQVGRYLEKYTDRYIPREVLRMRHRVVRTTREENEDGKIRWTVYWVDGSNYSESESVVQHRERKVHSEQFDFLVVASGYFSRPHVPDIPGLSGFNDRTIHSSVLHDAHQLFHLMKEPNRPGKLVVIGGSMSGVEAASALALRVSSDKFTPGSSGRSLEGYTVHHICTKPFWTVPTYVPRHAIDGSTPTETETVSFLPLDLVMYDLARRPPGPNQYSSGPVSAQQAATVNGYFQSLLGMDQRVPGSYGTSCGEEEQKHRPPWVAIGNEYTEFVRSGAISVTHGRVSAVQSSESDRARVYIRHSDAQETVLADVAAIILATGFTPFDSLSFLPTDVLSMLEYCGSDSFCPIILDDRGTTRSEIPDLGFVGFYRGPYWGVMEMQARSLAQHWAADGSNDETVTPKQTDERQRLRDLRSADPNFHRGQFPMGDYVGLMESWSHDLGISRVDLDGSGGGCGRSGPVVPARYPFDRSSPEPGREMRNRRTTSQNELEITLNSLRAMFSPEREVANIAAAAASSAIFRALHGRWKFSRTYRSSNGSTDEESRRRVSGTAAFHPRYPSRTGSEREYIYDEIEERPNLEPEPSRSPHRRPRLVYRLLEDSPVPADNAYIRIWRVDPATDPSTADDAFSHCVKVESVLPRYRDDKQRVPGEYLVSAVGAAGTTGVVHGGLGDAVGDSHLAGCGYEYTFHLQGVSITSWECIATVDHSSSYLTTYER